jgi:hypothetical protein
MSNQLYCQVLPTTVEQAQGFVANDRVVFQINHEGQQLRPKKVRLNGLLQLWRDSVGGNKVTATDKLLLDPDAGVNGFIRQITTRFGNNTVECINDYGRWCKMKNEAKMYQIDNATSSDSMLELMTYSNDAYVGGDDLKINVTQGMKFPLDPGSNEIPFSIDLDICVNGSNEPIPYSRTGQIEIAIILQDNTKCGMLSKLTPNTNTYCYSMKYLEVRYLADPEQQHAGAIILETKSQDHIPTILNKFNGIQFSPAHAYDSIVCTFLKSTHNSTAANFNYNYLESEAISEQIDYLEFKLDGHDDVLQYPLMKQTSEILYNYLLSWKPYIHQSDDMEVKKHGLTYGKLANANKSGFGVGVHLHGGANAGSKATFNIILKDKPTEPYRMYFYAIGKLII